MTALPPEPKKPPTKKTTTKKTTTKKTSSKKSSSSSGIKKTSDKPQVKALQDLLKSGFKAQRTTKLNNIATAYKNADADLLKGYGERASQLQGSRRDNEKAEADASFGNLGNRAREMTDILAQTAEMGAGETDTLRSQMMAIRNWDANQNDINRSYFDTVRSINASIVDLNADTRTARINAATQMLGDKEQAYANYYNQRVEALTQLGNIRANPYSNQYKKNAKDGYAKMAKEAAKAWKNPGVKESITSWEGTTKTQEGNLNNDLMGTAASVKQQKKPEGSTILPRW